MKNLIQAATVKLLTVVGQSAEDHKLEMAIPDAQTRYLRPLVGGPLLTQLLAFVADAPQAKSLVGLPALAATAQQQADELALKAWRDAQADNPLLALWDELKSCLAQWAFVEAWPNLLIHIDAAGMTLKTGSNTGTTIADAATLKVVLGAHRDTAIWRGQELVSFLESNKTKYPAYQSTTPTATGRQPISDFGGISI